MARLLVMAKRPSYQNPPLVEALCHFQFVPGSEWDIAIPGLLYQRIQEHYPERRQQKEIHWVVSPAAGELEKKSTADRMQFKSPDGKSLVQVGPDLLVVNALEPYPGWDTFKSLILGALSHYQEVAHPVAIRTLSLRYINRIVFPSAPVTIEDFLRFYPTVPLTLPQTFVGWALSVNIPASDEDLLRITSGSNEDNPEEVAFVLDIEFIALTGCQLDQVGKKIEQGHESVQQAFEECITDKARQVFKEEESHEHASSF